MTTAASRTASAGVAATRAGWFRANSSEAHTAVEDCARVAAAAGVKTLVLSHLVPADDPSVTEQTWLDAARPHFSGRIIVGRDLMEL